MHFKEALDLLEEKIRGTESAKIRLTLRDIYEVMLRSSVSDGKLWAKKIETVVHYVEAGHYAFCYPEAQKLLNKRVYEIRKD